MGTSKTSAGPGGNVKLVPDFLTPASTPPPESDSSLAGSPESLGAAGGDTTASPPPVTPPTNNAVSASNRFQVARRSINRFAKTGGTGDLMSALGSYVQRGYGGGGTAGHRMAKGAQVAAGVYGLLRATADHADSTDAVAGDPQSYVVIAFDPTTLAGLSHDEVAERIADAICPENVSLDDAGAREAVTDALSEILTENPDADILALPDFLIDECYVRTLAYSTANVILADIGASIQKGAADNAVVANQRYEEVRQFVLERYREQSSALREIGQSLDRHSAQAFGSRINTEVMSVFESYIQ